MSNQSETTRREGSLEAPMRHPLGWKDAEFYDENSLLAELERVFDICHGCRRCFSLCNAFPKLFDAIDESDSMELDGVDRADYWKVVDHCYLCDLCFMTKCPYVPPHEWNVDFPHLMLRAKAVKHKAGKTRTRDKIFASTDSVGKLAGIPIVVNVVNSANQSKPGRKLLHQLMGVHQNARLPSYHNSTLRKRLSNSRHSSDAAEPADPTKGRVVLFATCYCNYNEPQLGEDLVAVFAHNGIPVTIAEKERCCGMPKLELGDLDAIDRARQINVVTLAELVDAGWDIVAPVPSCVLMFKQELPLMFPDDPEVIKVRDAIYDPFEYLALRHRAGKLKTDFKQSLGNISYHVACHLRVQNIGLKTKEVLSLVPDTQIDAIERCSGHNGTYALKREFHETSMKIGRPVVSRVQQKQYDYYSSDCPMAGHQIANGLNDGSDPTHPLTLLRHAYGC